MLYQSCTMVEINFKQKMQMDANSSISRERLMDELGLVKETCENEQEQDIKTLTLERQLCLCKVLLNN